MGELGGNGVGRGDGGGAGVVVVVLPGGEGAVALSGCANLDDAGGAEVGPGKLLAAGPHQLDRLAGGLGQARGFHGGFAGVLAAIAAAHIGLDDVNLVGG